MTDYLLPSDIRDYLKVSGSSGSYSDALLGSNITVAGQVLHKATGRQFHPETATKRFTTHGRTAMSIPDLRSVTSVTLQGTALTADSTYYLIPDRANSGVYVAIQMRAFRSRTDGPWWLGNPEWFDRNLDSPYYAAHSDSGLPNDLAIAGDWGYLAANMPPAYLLAQKVLAAWYTLRPSSVLANVSVTADGAIRSYGDMPPEVVTFIEEWRLGDAVVAL